MDALHEARVTTVLNNLATQGLTQALVCEPLSIKYLTDYYTQPYERFFALLVSTRGTTLFVNKLFPSAAGAADTVVSFTDVDDPVPLVAAACDCAAPLGVDKALEARWLLPLMQMWVAPRFELGSFAVDNARSIKDQTEQELMREASRLNDEAMAWLASQVRPEASELSIAEGLLGEYRRLGSEGYSFSPIVSFGAHAADPHHEPDASLLQPGQMVLFDVGCLWQGYCSDMTRTFFTAKPTAHQLEVYYTVRRANEAAAAIVRPGVEFAEIDRTARSIIEDAGYGPYFTHRLGHQIGLSEHEPGDVSATHHEPVQPGQIFSIEPGIYLPNDVGVRIEDLCLVTEEGCEILNHYPHDVQVLQL